MDIEDLIKIEYHGERVLTTKQIGNFYGCTPRNIRNNYEQNKSQFIEGVHYFKLTGEKLKEFKAYFAQILATSKSGAVDTSTLNFVFQNGAVEISSLDVPFTKMANCLYLWTLQGCVRHCKLVGTKKSWEVFNKLEKNYFGKAAPSTPAPVEENFDEISFEQFERFEKFVANCAVIKNENLREKLIKTAAKFLLRTVEFSE